MTMPNMPYPYNPMSTFDSSGNGKRKRRILFNQQQVVELEKQFRIKKYLNAQEREALANAIGLKPTQVSFLFKDNQIWQKKKS